MSGRLGAHSSPSKARIKIGAGSVVCQEAEIKGEVIIGSKTVIHPKARIIAEAGPIIIGDNNLIEEQANILNLAVKDGINDSTEPITMTIGNYNVFEVGCTCEAVTIGDNNVLEAKSQVGRQVVLTNGCIVGAMCSITSQDTLQENLVVYGNGCYRRVQCERPMPQTLQMDFLTKILPNYHHLKKPSRG